MGLITPLIFSFMAISYPQEFGWQLRPLTRGDYPPEMRQTMGNSLPQFTPEESASLKDSYDLIYFDAYTSTFVKHINEKCTRDNDDWPACLEYPEKDINGHPIGNKTGNDWNFASKGTIYRGELMREGCMCDSSSTDAGCAFHERSA